MKLYELTSTLAQLQALIEDGEVTQEQVMDTLDSLNESIDDKVQGIVSMMKNIDGDVVALKEEEKRLAERRKSLESKVEGLKNYISINMQAAGIKQVKTALFTAKFAKNPPSVNVIDEKMIPERFFKVEVIEKLDRKELLTALKNGEIVDGAEIQQKESLRIK